MYNLTILTFLQKSSPVRLRNEFNALPISNERENQAKYDPSSTIKLVNQHRASEWKDNDGGEEELKLLFPGIGETVNSSKDSVNHDDMEKIDHMSNFFKIDVIGEFYGIMQIEGNVISGMLEGFENDKNMIISNGGSMQEYQNMVQKYRNQLSLLSKRKNQIFARYHHKKISAEYLFEDIFHEFFPKNVDMYFLSLEHKNSAMINIQISDQNNTPSIQINRPFIKGLLKTVSERQVQMLMDAKGLTNVDDIMNELKNRY